MESIAYIVALSVGVALMAWYVANEARGTDGAAGFLAIGGDGEYREDDPTESARYRIRPRLTPDRRPSLRPGTPLRAYRMKAPGRPSYRIMGDDEADAGAEADKEY